MLGVSRRVGSENVFDSKLFQEQFEAMDSDGSAAISLEEFVAFFHATRGGGGGSNKHATKSKSKSKAQEQDQEVVISPPADLHLDLQRMQQREHKKEEMVKTIFKRIDFNGNDSISRQEIFEFFQKNPNMAKVSVLFSI